MTDLERLHDQDLRPVSDEELTRRFAEAPAEEADEETARRILAAEAEPGEIVSQDELKRRLGV